MSWLSIQTRIVAVLFCVGVFVALTESAVGQDVEAVLKAYESKANSDEAFDQLFQFVGSSGEEEKWRQISWIPSLWTGVEIANEKQKPIFVWAMNGDPLGCV